MGVCFSVSQGHGTSMVWPSSCDLAGHNTVTLINAQPIYTPQSVVWPGTPALIPSGFLMHQLMPHCLLDPVCKAAPGAVCGALQFLAGLGLFFLSRERLLENARGRVALPRT